jgi:nucleotide-binding universal stress UspA family protein
LLSYSAVLMPFDGSPQSVGTFPLAWTIARAMEGSLHLVLSGEQTGIRERLPLLAEGGSEAILHELLGDLATGIVHLAAFTPGTFIVTPSYSGARPESGLGAFQEELLCRADCPVLLVQPGTAWTAWTPKRILVPQDGSAEAARALCPAARLAEHTGAEMLILHVSSDCPTARLAEHTGAEMLILHVSSDCPTAPPRPGALEFPAYVDRQHHEWPSWVACFLERVRHLCSLSALAELRFQWAHGDPAREIVAVARQKRADLVTMSWQRSLEPGCSQIVRQVVRDSPCPILILPGISC